MTEILKQKGKMTKTVGSEEKGKAFLGSVLHSYAQSREVFHRHAFCGIQLVVLLNEC